MAAEYSVVSRTDFQGRKSLFFSGFRPFLGEVTQKELNMHFYKCEICGNLLDLILDGRGRLDCCGQEMDELPANTVDASKEKHVPEVTVSGNKVQIAIGSVLHPMVEEHHINFICLETDKCAYRKALKIGEQPIANFTLTDGEKPVAAYEYCNLHGLWKKVL